MLYNFQRRKLCRHLLVGGVLCAAGFASFSCKDGYDLDSEQPTGLNSIYGYMQQRGDFKNFLQLIDDLGETETLSKSGSKTLFVANDDAFSRFYQSNSWGVKRYEDLTESQKKLLLRSAMIDNPYTTSMLSSIGGESGIVEGECMRRSSSQSLYDSVSVYKKTDAEIPETTPWKVLSQDEFVLFKDASSAAPMIHFMPRFLEQNYITSADIDFLYNDPEGTRESDDAYVNRSKIIDANIFCKNGFLHEVNEVILPLDNMAEIIRKSPATQRYSSLLERYSAPIYVGRTATDAYNENKGTHYDSVYAKRYFSSLSQPTTTTTVSGGITTITTSNTLDKDNDGNLFDGLLKFDPGWNAYAQSTSNMMENMAVMLVPTDAALEDWWNNGGGAVLKDRYKTWDAVPNTVLAALINNNMLISLTASVPSKFKTILDDANMEMGVNTESIDSVLLGCNGAVYVTNKVYTPTTYSSVLFPSLINENMNIFYKAVKLLQYDAYLNSMVTKYSLFIPTNDGLLRYVDPVSFGLNQTVLWEFHYDETAKSEHQMIYADTYKYEKQADGTWVKGDFIRKVTSSAAPLYTIPNDAVYDRLRDLLEHCIVIGEIEDGKTYYQTKGLSYLRVDGHVNPDDVSQMKVYGGWQIDQNTPLAVDEIYNMNNGKAYILKKEPVMTTTNALSDLLAEKEDFSEFYNYVSAVGAFARTVTVNNWTSASKNGNFIYVPENTKTESIGYLFNSYHYTLYAPTNAAMQEAYEAGLPTLEMYEEAVEMDDNGETTDSAAHLRKVMLNFIKYHVQDNAIYIDKGFNSGNYETARANTTTGRPYKLAVTVDENDLTVKGVYSAAQKVNKSVCYNAMVREYWLNKSSIAASTKPEDLQISTSSTAVVHAIDHPLLYSAKQFIYDPNDVLIGGEDEGGEEEEAKLRK
ncbi:MAG: fasciclin domain-containing protein [Bacteroides sp.]|nr:fasciclin domain-containing protein [Roseburia sp.]MCM1346538.1 fasciclin domain-containing protein [Bacteroides sp.]MCM1421099.1 fasciclin domain-containing protein [Bacteroides sp.]